MTIDLDELIRTLRTHFPVEGRYSDIDVGRSWGNQEPVAAFNERGDIKVIFRLVTWESRGGERSIRDIKEQEVWFIPADHAEDGPRLRAYIEGHAMALKRVVDHFTDIDMLMPNDVIHPRILTLKRPQSAEDFARALAVPSRLGRLMAGG